MATKATINDIARKTSLSKTSVSFAFNNPGRLPQETVRRILKAAEELGYSPNPVARSMTTGRTGVIGILVPQSIPEMFQNPFLPALVEGVGQVCTGAGLSLMLVPPLEGSLHKAIINAAVDGFITLGLEEFKATVTVLRQRGVPFVTLDSDPIDDVPGVNVDDEGGARAVLTHVLQAGHRDIAILGIRSGKHRRYREYAGTLRARIQGYQAALEAHGLSLDDPRVRLVECVATAEGGRTGFEQIWKGRRRPTALVAMGDIIAIGAIERARQLGVRVPEDLSVAGFDDIPLAAWVCPPLTTVAQPMREKGELATTLLLRLIEGNRSPTHHMLQTALVVRESVGAPSGQRPGT